ncbi:cell envelope biogenesis protein OmpA [Pseudalgibacter alginicilyticus]|uniref:Cell envelope biogenesis protein OmpA n=1 Tax=Pseudalgibacter alginicilyticus TaxID=1736674 RepID=A0A0P0D4S8_9FLAO|nr:outer membrane beta-barrel protein [Pseudalgibacter alginicilyticus]ALJ05953.1 cell envelope biogenesis protein OmpA [Pseudalgibacter alginicilyticus]
MTSNFKLISNFTLVLALCFLSLLGFSQNDTSKFKAQFALGVNNPSPSGFVNDFEAKLINFPSINLGLQYMLKSPLGLKLDFGYNRFSNLNDTPDFKVNYTRINAQLVYDTYGLFGVLPQQMGVFVHAGPGFSIIKPLGNYPNNNISFLNTMVGMEFHYAISDTFSVFLDGSYILGFSNDFNPVSDGFGSFNGNLLTISIGASISLSGCYYCN